MPACAMERCGAYRLHIMCAVGPITTSCGTSMCVKACGWRIGVGTNRLSLLVRRRSLVHTFEEAVVRRGARYLPTQYRLWDLLR